METEYNVTINWSLCRSYAEASAFVRVLYVHVNGDKPVYWGKAESSWLAGKIRDYKGARFTSYYTEKDRHWIDRCLEQGDRLYVGEVDKASLKANPRMVSDVLDWLKFQHPTPYNRDKMIATPIRILHTGYVPACLRERDEDD
ncbi:hypothetical protein B1757_13135 [Acidithiobacillus marinus]|uniref:Uncharacterized protein n=1 Tax=Acidithiobacillus marinus TaxID=187490 RepID=A0A2I1DIT0_9PROT|nr:hypothetical protein [Acidithiobacillus marinus]PKY09783.1 hypothetical protein B1757_13135 [Acidithiobacillus marinus]